MEIKKPSNDLVDRFIAIRFAFTLNTLGFVNVSNIHQVALYWKEFKNKIGTK